MKKKIGILIIGLVALTLGLFLGTQAKAASQPSLTQTQGASVRTSGNQGIRFSAQIEHLTGVTEHGFYVVKGEFTTRDMYVSILSNSTNVFGAKLVKVQATTSDLAWNLTVFNINNANYAQNITALAYAVVNGEKILATPVTRSLGYVANKAKADGNTAALIATVANYVDANYYAVGMKDANTLAFQDASTTTLTEYALAQKNAVYTLPKKLGYNVVYKDGGSPVTTYNTTATKEFSVESTKKTFSTVEVNAIYNASAYGTEVSGQGIVGENLFGTIKEATLADVRATPDTKLTINVAKGEYKYDFTLPSNTDLLGNYATDASVGATPRDEALKTKFSGKITLEAGTKNVKIAGFDFGGNAAIEKETSTASGQVACEENIVFENNAVIRENNNSFYTSNQTGLTYASQLVFKNNVFTDSAAVTGAKNMISLNDVDGLVIEGNKFTDIKGHAFYVKNNNLGVIGDLTIQDNEFKNIAKSAFFAYYCEPRTAGKNVLVTGNDFNNVQGSAALDFEYAKTTAVTHKYETVKINQNKFTGGSKLVYFGRVPSKDSQFRFNEIKYDYSQTEKYIFKSSTYNVNYGTVDVYGNVYKDMAGVVQEAGSANVEGKMLGKIRNLYTMTMMSVSDLTVKIGETKEANISYTPTDNSENAIFTVASSEENKATVVRDGGKIKVTGVTTGQNVIMKYTYQKLKNDGTIETLSGTFTVDVVLGINGDDAVLQGKSATYTYAGSGTQEWSSSDPTVLSIDSTTGVAQGVSVGQATITLKINGSQVDTKVVNVAAAKFMVDDDWSSKKSFDEMTVGTDKYYYGVNAFSTLAQVMATSNIPTDTSTDVVFADGTYAGGSITKKLNIIGANKDVDPNTTTRKAESIFTSYLLVTHADVNINGIYLGTGSRIATNKDNLKVSYIKTASIAQYYAVAVHTSAPATGVKNLTVEYSQINTADATRGIRTYKLLTGLRVYKTKFTGPDNVATDALRMDHIAGKVEVISNEFIGFGQRVVYFGGSVNTSKDFSIINNTFTDGAKAAWYGDYISIKNLPADADVKVTYNTFNTATGGPAVDIRPAGAMAANYPKIIIENNKFMFTDKLSLSHASYTGYIMNYGPEKAYPFVVNKNYFADTSAGGLAFGSTTLAMVLGDIVYTAAAQVPAYSGS